MTRQVLDEYLDGALSPAQTAEVEAVLRTEAAAAGRLEKMKQERDLRGAALGSYAPSSEEAESAAVRMIAALQDEAELPVFRIGAWRWLRRAGAIAAVLAIVAGAFVLGRATASVQTVIIDPSSKAASACIVLYSDDAGETRTKPFDSELAAQAFLAERVQAQGRQAVASIDEQGTW